MTATPELRFVTYLSPGLPRGLFEAVAGHVGRALEVETSLVVEPDVSGPPKGSDDPFSRGEADVGFMCAPPFLWLHERGDPPVELAGAAPVFRDTRAEGKPVYFSEVVARRGVESLSEIRVWAYNDPCSMSGYFSLLEEIGAADAAIRSGSHAESIRMILAGEADAAAIDSNVLRMAFAKNPALRTRLRAIESRGPYPIQPVALRSSLPEETKSDILASLLSIGSETAPEFALEGFAPVTLEHYEEERAALRECERMAAEMRLSGVMPM